MPTATATATLTYAEHGATRGRLPSGYHHIDRRELIGHGPDVFDRAAVALTTWQMHRGAGLAVAASAPVAAEGSVVTLEIGWRRLSVSARCRVVYVVDEPHRRGFAYGTLAGHPERGEEAFVVELRDNAVWCHIRAFSAPASLISRISGPAGRMVQQMVTSRYLAALRTLATHR